MQTPERCVCLCDSVTDFKTHAPSRKQNEQEKASTGRFKIRQKQRWETYFAIAIKASLLDSAKLTSSGEITVTFFRPSNTWKNTKIEIHKSKAFFSMLNLDIILKWVQSCMKEASRQQSLDSHQEWPAHFPLPFGPMSHSKGIIQPLAFPLTLPKQD